MAMQNVKCVMTKEIARKYMRLSERVRETVRVNIKLPFQHKKKDEEEERKIPPTQTPIPF